MVKKWREEFMDVISVKPFLVRGNGGQKYMVNSFEHGTVLSGFGFLKLQFKKSGDQVFHADEAVLGKQLLSHAEYHTTFKNDPQMMERLDNPPIGFVMVLKSTYHPYQEAPNLQMMDREFLKEEEMEI